MKTMVNVRTGKYINKLERDNKQLNIKINELQGSLTQKRMEIMRLKANVNRLKKIVVSHM